MMALRKLTILALVASLAACSATPVRRSLKEGSRDAMTASKVRYKLMRDKEVQKTNMHVEVFRGVVTLTGRAMTDAEKQRAETVAKSVKNVTGVENFVHVVGNDATPAKPAVAKNTSKKGTVSETIIEEIVVVPAATAPKVATYTVSTGSKTAPVKADTAVAKVPAKSTAKNATAKETKLAKTPAKSAKETVARKVAPVISVPSVGETPVSTPKTVVGKSSTGLPWDGEVYADDASAMSSIKTPAKVPVTATTSRSPVKEIAATNAVVAPKVSAPPAGDDLAQEAARELERLRQK